MDSVDLFDCHRIKTSFGVGERGNESQVSVICSQTQLLIFILLRGSSTKLVLTTTCFGLYIGHHQVVHFLIIKQTIQYTLFLFLSKRSRAHDVSPESGNESSVSTKYWNFID